MSIKIKKVVNVISIIILTIIVALIIGLAIYINIIDITTTIPKKFSANHNIVTENIMGRNVFVISDDKNINLENMKYIGQTEKIIIYFHGGSYFGNGTEDHFELIEKMIKDTNAIVIFPDYPLAPKHDYEDVFNMLIPMYESILSEVNKEEVSKGIEIEVILLGDSSAGGMALGLLQELSENNKNEYMPDKTILVSPLLDVRLENSEIKEIEKNDDILNKEVLQLAGWFYAGEDGMESHLVNPILGSMDGIENLTIFTGTYDILNADIDIIVEKAKSQGVEIEIKEYEKANHVWFIENSSSEELNQKGYQDMIDVINR